MLLDTNQPLYSSSMTEKEVLEPCGKDYTRWLNREKLEENCIPNTVRILIGDEIIVCNGLILADWSPVLKDIIIQSDEVRLDEYCGHTEEFYDCLELLYGGKMSLSFKNIEVILQFSSSFEVKEMFEMCKDWLIRRMAPETMYRIFSLLDKYPLNFFKTYYDFPKYIRDNIASVTTEVEKKNVRYKFSFIELLLTQSCSIFLVLLNDWIQCETDVEEIVSFISFQYEESASHRISYYDTLLSEKDDARSATLNIIKRMKFYAVSDQTMSMIHELEGNLLKHLQEEDELFSMTRKPFLEKKLWTNLTESQIFSRRHGDFGLKPFEFAEVAVEWLKDDHRRRLQFLPTETILKRQFHSFFLLSKDNWSVQEDRLSWDYIKTLYSSVLINPKFPYCFQEKELKTSLPAGPIAFEMESHCFTMDRSHINALKKGEFVELGDKAHMRCDSLKAAETFPQFQCRSCSERASQPLKASPYSLPPIRHGVKFRLTESQPCYDLFNLNSIEFNSRLATSSGIHIYISYKACVRSCCKKLFSFVTHTRPEVIQFLEDLVDNQTEFSLNCLVANRTHALEKQAFDATKVCSKFSQSESGMPALLYHGDSDLDSDVYPDLYSD